MATEKSGFVQMMEDLVDVSGKGRVFRSVMAVLLFAGIAIGGWFEWKGLHEKAFVPPTPSIAPSERDENIESLPNRFEAVWRIRNAAAGTARDIRNMGIYAFNSFPPPEEEPDPEIERRKKLEEERMALIEAQKAAEQAVYEQVDPPSFMSVKSLMTGPGGRRTAIIAFVPDPFGAMKSVPRAATNQTGEVTYPVYTGVRLPLPLLSEDVVIGEIEDTHVVVTVKNGTWTLPVPGHNPIEALDLKYPSERRTMEPLVAGPVVRKVKKTSPKPDPKLAERRESEKQKHSTAAKAEKSKDRKVTIRKKDGSVTTRPAAPEKKGGTRNETGRPPQGGVKGKNPFL